MVLVALLYLIKWHLTKSALLLVMVYYEMQNFNC